MTAKKSTSRTRPSRNRAALHATADHDPSTNPMLKEDPNLIEAIEEERHRLMKAEAVLTCVLIAMDDDDGCIGEDGCTDDDDCIVVRTPYYPSVLGLARDLVNQTINQLDSVRLRPMVEEMMSSADYEFGEETLGLGKSGKDEVKDGGGIAYLC